jgi:hypothetical protein
MDDKTVCILLKEKRGFLVGIVAHLHGMGLIVSADTVDTMHRHDLGPSTNRQNRLGTRGE